MPTFIVPSSAATGHKSPTHSNCVIKEIEEPVDKMRTHVTGLAGTVDEKQGGNTRIRYGLSEEKMPQALKEDLKDFIKF